MGLLSKLFGFQSSDDRDQLASKNTGSTPHVLSLDALVNAKELSITETIIATVQAIAEEEFPDDEGVLFNATRLLESEGTVYVEVVPSAFTGYEKYVFVIQNETMKSCYCFEDGSYSLLSTSS